MPLADLGDSFSFALLAHENCDQINTVHKDG